jgi:hypothetical protein
MHRLPPFSPASALFETPLYPVHFVEVSPGFCVLKLIFLSTSCSVAVSLSFETPRHFAIPLRSSAARPRPVEEMRADNAPVGHLLGVQPFNERVDPHLLFAREAALDQQWLERADRLVSYIYLRSTKVVYSPADARQYIAKANSLISPTCEIHSDSYERIQ